jgi:dTDP-4-dehydrorhamnose 3,5-epimerase
MSLPLLTTRKLSIEGAIMLEDAYPFSDKRGTFKELFNMKAFHAAGLPVEWAQDNLATSSANVLRGLHIQKKRPQGKLVMCLQGKIIDVGVDLRKNSATFKSHAMVELENPKDSVYWPPGVAHGYYSPLESMVYYKCTTLHDKESDGGILWCDPELNISWENISPIVSTKDMCLPKLRDYLNTLS